MSELYGSSASVQVPVIETQRLRLRGHRRDDYAASVAMWSDPEVTRYIGGRPFTPEEIWSRLLRHVGHWAVLGFGYWVVQEQGSGRFVGEVGFADLQRDMQPKLEDPEIGWALAPWAHGRGFATEAVRAAVDWGAERFGERPTVCIIDPGNAASIRVAEKCGYRRVERATYKGAPTLLFARP